MSEKKRRIMLGFHSPVDARLMRSWVTGLGYEVVESFEDTSDLDLVFIDSASARDLMDKALGLKEREKYFLPVLVGINRDEDVARWLQAGFDDVLRLPASKAEWQARIEIMLRLRRQSEELAQKSEYLHRALVESSSDHIFMFDANGTYVTSNDRVTHLGLDRGEPVVGKTIEQVYPQEVAAAYREQFQRVLTERKTVVFEHDLPTDQDTYHHQDTLYPVNLPDGTVMVGGICRDITEQKHIEQQNRTNQKRLEEAERIGQFGNWSYELATGQIIWSAGVYRIYGVDPKKESIDYEKLLNLIHPDDREYHNKYVEKMRSLKPGDQIEHLEYRVVRPDGELRVVDVNFETDFDGDNKPLRFFGTVRDITERKNIEESYKEAKSNLEALLDNRRDSIWSLDRNYNYLVFNKPYEDIILKEQGIRIEKGMNAMDIHPEEVREFWKTKFDPVLNGEYVDFEFSHNLDGREHHFQVFLNPIYSDGKVTGLSALSMDITDRTKAEEFRRILETAINHTPECVLISDRKNRLTYVNRAFEKLTGYAATEALGNSPGMLKSWQHNRGFYQELKTTIYSGRPWSGLLTLRKKSGELYVAHTTITPILDQSGTPKHFISIHRDVTKERELEKRIQQNQRIEAIGTLAGGIAHDFNNILVPIVGYTQMCLHLLPKDSKIRGDMEQVRRAAARATDLVKQILSFSHRSNQQKEPIRVELIVKEALKLLRSTIPTSVEIRQDISATEESVIADPTEIHQVIMNLCINASHAMPDGGLMSVDLHAVALDRDASKMIPGCEPGRYVQLSVEDTGHGIAPEILGKIFEPYFTTKSEGQGTGFGLATTHNIVTACGGGIIVDSEPGQGTRFDLYFPVASRPETKDVEKTIVTKGGHERFLIVDDDIAVLNLHRKVLENYGYSVTTETDPEKALAIFEKSPADFDMVLTDMTMPRMTGDLLAAALLKVRPQLPVIVLTGHSERINKEKAQSMGIRQLLEKPVTPETLLAEIRKILDHEEG